MPVSHDVKIPSEYAAKLVDPAVYATDELFEIYAWLRANNPLGIAEADGFDPFWVSLNTRMLRK